MYELKLAALEILQLKKKRSTRMFCMWLELLVVAVIAFAAGSANTSLSGNLEGDLVQPILDTVLSSSATTTCTLNVDLILATVFSLAGPTDCKLCDTVAGLTKDVTCLLNKSCFKKTEELIKFHCLRPYVVSTICVVWKARNAIFR